MGGELETKKWSVCGTMFLFQKALVVPLIVRECTPLVGFSCVETESGTSLTEKQGKLYAKKMHTVYSYFERGCVRSKFVCDFVCRSDGKASKCSTT